MIKRLFIILVITIIGCAHFHKGHLDHDYVVSFSKPLIIRPPSHEPRNIKENVKFAIFLFEQQEYEDATSVFLKVAKEIQEPELKELSLKASAISAILANDREGFIRIMQELNMDNPYRIYEQDKVLQTLNALYKKFLRRR